MAGSRPSNEPRPCQFGKGSRPEFSYLCKPRGQTRITGGRWILTCGLRLHTPRESQDFYSKQIHGKFATHSLSFDFFEIGTGVGHQVYPLKKLSSLQ